MWGRLRGVKSTALARVWCRASASALPVNSGGCAARLSTGAAASSVMARLGLTARSAVVSVATDPFAAALASPHSAFGRHTATATAAPAAPAATAVAAATAADAFALYASLYTNELTLPSAAIDTALRTGLIDSDESRATDDSAGATERPLLEADSVKRKRQYKIKRHKRKKRRREMRMRHKGSDVQK